MENEMKELIDQVKIEAERLKELASKEELDKLDFQLLDGDNTIRCIYGLMTDNCFSERAKSLISNCCDKVYFPIGEADEMVTDSIINDKPNYLRDRYGSNTYFSPIEKFILLNDRSGIHKNNEILIDYLKGKIEKLEFIS